MAYVINPDGTITTVEADYDRNGNIKIKRGYSFEGESTAKSFSTSSSYGTPRKKKKKSHKRKTVVLPVIEETASVKVVANTGSSNTQSVAPKKIVVSTSPKKKHRRIRSYFITITEIDFYFKDKIASGHTISPDEYLRIRETLPEGLKKYFIAKYLDYASGNRVVDNSSKILKTLKKQRKKNKKKATQESGVISNCATKRTGFTLGEIATFSPMNKRTPDEGMVNGKPLYGASRNPKYGYARDRFGRVQERDSFNEDLRNEFKNAQRHQKNYDYSSYDENDDNDGAYSDWE